MLLDHNHHSSCKFAGDVVTFLYDEMGDGEKARFSGHLAACSSCTEDLAALSSVRSSVLDWRAADFLPLSTPVIVLPAVEPARSFVAKKAARSESSPSWLTSIGAFFKLSPVWITAAGAIIVCAGLAILFINFNPRSVTGDIAGVGNTGKAIIKTAPSIDESARSSNTDATQPAPDVKPNDKSGKSAEKPFVSKEPEPTQIMLTSPTKQQPAAKSVKTVITDTKTADVKSTQATSKKRPSLSGDDADEKDTLRLSDIFEEVSMR